MSKLLRQNVSGTDYTMAGCTLTGNCASASSDYVKVITLSDGDSISDGMMISCTFTNGNTAGRAPDTIVIYSSDQVNYYSDSGLTVPFTLAPSGCYTITYTGTGNAYNYIDYPVLSIGGVTSPVYNANGSYAAKGLWNAGDTVMIAYSSGKFFKVSLNVIDPDNAVSKVFDKTNTACYITITYKSEDKKSPVYLYAKEGTAIINVDTFNKIIEVDNYLGAVVEGYYFSTNTPLKIIIKLRSWFYGGVRLVLPKLANYNIDKVSISDLEDSADVATFTYVNTRVFLPLWENLSYRGYSKRQAISKSRAEYFAQQGTVSTWTMLAGYYGIQRFGVTLTRGPLYDGYDTSDASYWVPVQGFYGSIMILALSVGNYGASNDDYRIKYAYINSNAQSIQEMTVHNMFNNISPVNTSTLTLLW